MVKGKAELRELRRPAVSFALLAATPMDPALNPYTPGAGAPPPELAGRDAVLETARIAVVRTLAGRYARGQFLLGLRGVGKTVLLNRIRIEAESAGCRAVAVESPEGRALPDLLVPALRRLLLGLDRGQQAGEAVRRAARTLRSFASAFRVTLGEFEVGVEPGSADSGDIEFDLPDLLVAVGRAARERGTAAALFVDEVQYLSRPDLGALIVAAHQVAQRQVPVIVFGAGLPQLAGLAGDAKSYAERLFEYVDTGALGDADARSALLQPALQSGATIEPAALDRLVRDTGGYPYFLQEWGRHAWNVAAGPVITEADAEAATALAVEELDRGFFRVRLDRLTPREKAYLRAMAALGAGPHRSGAVADVLGMRVQSAGPLRGSLIAKGMIYSPAHGDTAFTVPMFDAFMRRTMPWPPEA